LDKNEFVRQVQNRGILASEKEAVKITNAVLTTLAERLDSEERNHLATQLSKDLSNTIMSVEDGQSGSFNLEEFYTKVKSRADISFTKAVPMSQIVISVLQDAIALGEQRQVIFKLPEEFKDLFGVKPETPEFVRYTKES